MRRALLTFGLVVLGAAPLAGQWLGMPVWNSPKGGSGISIYGDVGVPNGEYGKGTAYGARGSVGFGSLSVALGLASWKPDGADESVLSYGGQAAFRILGGALLPVSLNLQGSIGWSEEKAGLPKSTRAIIAAGLGANLPFLGVEVYASPGLRYTDFGELTDSPSGNESNFGMAIGASGGFSLVSVHLAYDFENTENSGTRSVVGLGASIGFRLPGM
jgi:hypothetical protein